MSAQNETKGARNANLPVLAAQPDSTQQSARGRSATSLHRYRLPSSFASQLLAERQNLMVQRRLRRAPNAVAVRAYEESDARKIRRVPVGFQFTYDA